jgi:hypothetical protein
MWWRVPSQINSSWGNFCCKFFTCTLVSLLVSSILSVGLHVELLFALSMYLIALCYILTLVFNVQGIVLLIILISGLMCMMGIDTPSRFEAPQESWSPFEAESGDLTRHRVEGLMFVGLHCGYCLVSPLKVPCVFYWANCYLQCAQILCNITFHVYGHLAEPLQTTICDCEACAVLDIALPAVFSVNNLKFR